jgi:hypothetical protein
MTRGSAERTKWPVRTVQWHPAVAVRERGGRGFWRVAACSRHLLSHHATRFAASHRSPLGRFPRTTAASCFSLDSTPYSYVILAHELGREGGQNPLGIVQRKCLQWLPHDARDALRLPLTHQVVTCRNARSCRRPNETRAGTCYVSTLDVGWCLLYGRWQVKWSRSNF